MGAAAILFLCGRDFCQWLAANQKFLIYLEDMGLT